jgi:PAS domain S-box-containing protein
MGNKIQDLEKNFLTILEAIVNATILIEDDKTISFANREFEKLTGYKRAEIEGKKCWDEFFPDEDLDLMVKFHRLRINGSAAPKNYECHLIDRNGSIKNIYATVSIIPKTRKMIASFTDITEQRRLEGEVIKICDQERHQIGKDLHDELGPHLVGIKFIVNLLKNKLDEKSIPEAKELYEINTLIDQAIQHTRRLVKGLCPVHIEDEGLSFALEELISITERVFGIPCSLTYDNSISIKDIMFATHLYYIVQEAINNAIKHGRAKHIKVSISKENEKIIMTVEDDGIGIPEVLDNATGMGLKIMKYRARLINSSIDIRRTDSGGTAVICAFKKNNNA